MCCQRDELRQEEHSVTEDVERIEEFERLEVSADGEDVLPPENAQVVGQLPNVLIENVVIENGS
jgi:hypothetical protein